MRTRLTLIIVLVIFAATACRGDCLSEEDANATAQAAVAAALASIPATGTPAPTATVAPTDTPVPTETPVPPTDTPVPTETPTATPQATNTQAPTDTAEATELAAPAQTSEPPSEGQGNLIADLEGAGETVTDNLEIAGCGKTVFYWTSAPGSYGNASLSAKLYRVGEDDYELIASDYASDAPGGITGVAVRRLESGDYFFAVENTDGSWRIRVECHDDLPAIGSGLDVTGTGDWVSGNLELPECQKSVFHWTTEADDLDSASLTVKLHKKGVEDYVFLVSEYASDVPEGIMGAALEPLSGGEYYFSVENTEGDWTLRWECQDEYQTAGDEIDISGETNTVTANYELPACKKSVFVWKVEPGALDSASISIKLFEEGIDGYRRVASEYESNQTSALEGESLQALSGGVYWLAVEDISGPWSVRWECRD